MQRLWSGLILVVFLSALLFRLQNLDQPIVEIMETRQTQTADIARNLLTHSFNVLLPQVNRFGPENPYLLLEFPLFNAFAALLHSASGIGLEKAGRLSSVFFWALGGFLLLKLLRRHYPDRAISAGWCFYLFAFIGLMISRVFQPESLVLCLYLSVLLELDSLNTDDDFGRRWWRLALLVSLACLSKAPMALLLAFPTAAILIRQFKYHPSNRKRITPFLALSFLPLLLWTAHARPFTIGTADIAANYTLGNWFKPGLFFDTGAFDYYRNLLLQFRYNFLTGSGILDTLIGIILLTSVFLLLADKEKGKFYIPVAGSILLYFFLFNFHTATHYYYHFPLLPLFAVSLSHLASKLPRLYHTILLAVLITGALISLNWAKIYMQENDYSRRLQECASVIRKTVPEDQLLITSMADQEGLHYYSDRVGWVFTLNRQEFLKHYEIVGSYSGFEMDAVKAFENLVSRGARYYANCDQNSLQAHPGLAKYLTENFDRIYHDPEKLVIFKLR